MAPTMDPSAQELASARARTLVADLEQETKADDAPETDLAAEDFLGEAEPEADLAEEDFLDEAEEEPQRNLEDRRQCRQAYRARILGS